MRTTVNLDPEVLSKVRLLSKQKGVPLGIIISDLIQEALRPQEQTIMRNGVPIFPRKEGLRKKGAPPDLELVNSLRD